MGMAVGFDENTADVRIAQYESGTRTPKEKYVNAIAHVLEVDSSTLMVPEIDSYIGIMHTFFALEDNFGLKVDKIDGRLCLTLDTHSSSYHSMFSNISAWQQETEKLENGEISKEEYDKWRYNYPKFDDTQIWAKVPSKEFSDAMVKRLKDK